MHPDELNIDAYLRGELSLEETERIADLLETSAKARKHADWLMRLENLAEQARLEPPAPVVEALQARLLALPSVLEGAGSSPAVPLRPGRRVLRLPGMRYVAAPALRVAAALVAGVLIGYGLWGRNLRTMSSPTEFPSAPAARATMPAALEPPAGETGTLQDLESRVESLEATMQAAYFARVQAAVLRFVTNTSEGTVGTPEQEDTRDLLALTANLKASSKSTDDVRMARLLGQIESVLMEMDRLARESDLEGSRHVASVIEEQGLLATLQSFKVGVEK